MENNINVCIINCDFDENKETNGGEIIENLLKTNKFNNVLIKDYTKNDFLKKSEIDNYSHFIITGSRASINSELTWIKELLFLIKLLNEKKKLTLGICFGFQAIARVLGRTVVANNFYIEGYKEIILTENGKKENIFINFPEKFYAYESYGDKIEKFPESLQILAQNNQSIQAFKLNNFFAVQFHPEITPEIATIMAIRDKKDTKKIIGDISLDYLLPTNMILNFLKYY